MIPVMSEGVAVRREAVPMNILIVDDEMSIRETCATVPEQCGMKAVAVAEVTRMGAVDYVTKPFRIEELLSRLERVARAVELQQENRLLRANPAWPARPR
jgi:DNA-binding response OmpR family regulator